MAAAMPGRCAAPPAPAMASTATSMMTSFFLPPFCSPSSAPFVAGILKAGLRHSAEPLRAIRVLKTVEVREGAGFARLSPAEQEEYLGA